MQRPLRVLSLDGGGIRGIIPVVVLEEIERRAGQPICRLFDLIAGTSTGGILALGLTKRSPGGEPEYRAADLRNLYVTQGPSIFHQSLGRRILSLGKLLEAKYPASNIDDVLLRYFGDQRLADALTPVVIPAFEIQGRRAWFFRSARAATDEGYNFLMREVARATSAAPTYFPPVRLLRRAPDPDSDRPDYALVDGGVFANNPAMCAYVEAQAARPQQLLLVSIGTGGRVTPIEYDQARGWGVVGWAQPILDVVFDGINDTTEYQLGKLLKPSVTYYRFQAKLRPHEDKLDDASPENIKRLTATGAAIVAQRSGDLDTLVGELLGTDTPLQSAVS